GGIVSSRFLLAAVRCRWTLWVVVDLATFVCLWHVGGAGGQWWSLVHAASHAGLSVPPASTTMVDSCGPVRTCCGVSKRRQAHRRSDHRNSLPVAGHNLCVFDCRHLSQRGSRLSLVAIDSGNVVTCGCVRGHCLSHSRNAFPGFNLPFVINGDGDLVRVREFWLDVAVVCRRHCDGRVDHLHVCGI